MTPNSSDLPPVRPPLRRLWREFRIQVLPWIGLATMALLVALLWLDVVLLEPVSAPDLDAAGEEWQLGTDPALSSQRSYLSHPGISNGLNDCSQTKD